MTPETLVLAPIALPFNPVWRSYAGGKVLRRFRGQPGDQDNHFPEDWLASTVRARNGQNSQTPDEGLSRIGNSIDGQIVTESLQQHPEFWFGARQGHGYGINVLWKLLDSSVRLQLQAHPDARYARQHLNSNAGKTECWYIIATREDACVYLGFQRPPTREAWGEMIRTQNIEAMLACFDRIPVQSGDCCVVPAGAPHAIGAGVFMMELMEPTDWAVRCETVNAGVTLPPDQCFMGLDLERCLDVFDYRPYSVEKVRTQLRQDPQVVHDTDHFCEEEMIHPNHHGFFRLHRFRGSGRTRWLGGELMLVVVLQGKGLLRCGSDSGQIVQAGQTWLLPGAAPAWEWMDSEGECEFLLARLPLPDPGSAGSATRSARR